MSSPFSEPTLPHPPSSEQQQPAIHSSPPPVDIRASFDTRDESPDLVQMSEPAESNEVRDIRPKATRANSGDTERPPSAQHVDENANEPQIPAGEEENADEPPKPDQEEDAEEEFDPAERLATFDWNGLHERYHDAMDNATGQEAELLREWSELMGFFKIWAEAGHSQETDRTFSRLRTRMAYVENAEDRLEKTRNHYVSVVKAFESALALLKNAGLG